MTRKSLAQPTRKPYESTTRTAFWTWTEPPWTWTELNRTSAALTTSDEWISEHSQRNPSQNSDSAADDQRKSSSQGTSDSPRDFVPILCVPDSLLFDGNCDLPSGKRTAMIMLPSDSVGGIPSFFVLIIWLSTLCWPKVVGFSAINLPKT